MSLQRLLRLLPIGLVALFSLNMAMMLVQDRQSRATFDQVGIAQVQRDVLGKIRTNCEALTFKAVAWTLTRRSSQGRQYQEGQKACPRGRAPGQGRHASGARGAGEPERAPAAAGGAARGDPVRAHRREQDG